MAGWETKPKDCFWWMKGHSWSGSPKLVQISGFALSSHITKPGCTSCLHAPPSCFCAVQDGHWDVHLTQLPQDITKWRECVCPELSRNRNFGAVGLNIEPRVWNATLKIMGWARQPVSSLQCLPAWPACFPTPACLLACQTASLPACLLAYKHLCCGAHGMHKVHVV